MSKSIKWLGILSLTWSLVILATPTYAQDATTPKPTDPITLLLLGLGLAAILLIFGAYGLHMGSGNGNHDEDDE